MPDAPKRPGSLTFVAIVLFTFGFVYLLNSAATGFYAGIVVLDPQEHDPNAKIAAGDVSGTLRFIAGEIPGWVAISLVISVLDILFAIGQIMCGINVMRLKPSARKATILLIVTRLLYILAYDGFAAVVVLPIELRLSERQMADIVPAGGGQADLSMVMGLMKIAIYGVFGLKVLLEIFAAGLLLLLLSTSRAKNAFAGIPDVPETSIQEERQRTQYAGYEDDDAG
jgi:hypothetical protein